MGTLAHDNKANGTTSLDEQARWKHLETAVEILTDLESRTGDAANLRFLHAICLRELPDRNDNQGDNRSQAISLLKKLAEDFPKVARYRFELCETFRRHRQVSAEQRIEDLLNARGLAKDLVVEQDTIAAYRISLAHVYAHLGVESNQIGKHQDAEKFTRLAMETHDSIVRDFPGLAKLSLELSTTDRLRLGAWMLNESRYDELIALLQPTAERLYAELEAANEEGNMGEFSEETINTKSFLRQCGNLLMPAYNATGDDVGYFVTLGWLDAASQEQPIKE
jgi:tetratricopeptide (TPR) repeat protein